MKGHLAKPLRDSLAWNELHEHVARNSMLALGDRAGVTGMGLTVLTRGSLRVFEQAISSFHGAWYRYARRLVGSSGCGFDADDILQDAYTATLQAAPDFLDVRAVNRYVCLAIDTAFHRWLVFRRRMVPLDTTGAGDVTWGSPSPTRLIISQQFAEAFWDALQLLTPEERDALLLFYVAAWKQDAIAEKQEVTQQAVSARISRALGKLRAALLDRFGALDFSSPDLAIRTILDTLEGSPATPPPTTASDRCDQPTSSSPSQPVTRKIKGSQKCEILWRNSALGFVKRMGIAFVGVDAKSFAIGRRGKHAWPSQHRPRKEGHHEVQFRGTQCARALSRPAADSLARRADPLLAVAGTRFRG